MRKLISMFAAAAVALALAATPASAATTVVTIGVSGDFTHLTFNPQSPLTISPGDTVEFQGFQGQQYWTNPGCSGQVQTFSSATLDVTLQSTAIYSFADSLNGFPCVDFEIDVTSNTTTTTVGNPPPDVPEAPYTAGLLGAAGLLLGGGFFVLRRRHSRVA